MFNKNKNGNTRFDYSSGLSLLFISILERFKGNPISFTSFSVDIIKNRHNFIFQQTMTEMVNSQILFPRF